MSKAIFKIDTADCIQDVEEGCYDDIERGLFTAEQALRVLENGNGGAMWAPGIGSYGVSHIREKNQWLRDEFKKKGVL